MLFRKPKEVDRKLEKVTERLLDDMIENGPDTEEYETYLSYLERVKAIRPSVDKTPLNPNNMSLVLGNLLGIVIIVIYEQKHVFTSKAQALLLKSK